VYINVGFNLAGIVCTKRF